ncbi:MAG: deoxynucleoside kinase [Solirubrobacteraceae bacterium]
MIIAVCGNTGSGKTTLARGLGQARGWRVLTPEEDAIEYMKDLLRDPRRWSLEAQTAFLLRRCDAVRRMSRMDIPVVLDRSIDEDIDVFARYWHEQGALDDRALRLYMDIAALAAAECPHPDLYIYCMAQPQTCMSRLARRPSSHYAGFPPAFVESLAIRYESWWKSLNAASKLPIDTEQIDSRTDKGVEVVLDGVQRRVGPSTITGQLSLLPGEGGGHSTRRRLAPKPRRPSIYLAGPFTGTTIEDDPTSGDRLFSIPQLVIPADSTWRLTLERTSRALANQGFQVCLPHRDISAWGAGASSPRAVADACLRAVAECDIVLAILGRSFGTHVEVGAAVGLGRPVVVVAEADDPPSFVGGGISAAGFAAEIQVASLDELPQLVKSEEFRTAVARAEQARRLSRGL